MNNLKHLYKLIDNSDVVSFDIYDTLLKRIVVSPYDIFELTQLIYERENNKLGFEFLKVRMKCESLVRKSCSNDEISLDDIYEEINKTVNIDSYILEKLKIMELELESNLIEKNDEIIDVYNYAKKSNKKIIITSDMYLPKETIEAILKNKDIEYSNLFLSSDIFKTKAKGSIYPYLINELGVDLEKIIHIGDNKNSDYKKSIENGLNAYWYNNHQKITRSKVDSNKILNIINSGIVSRLTNDDYWYNFGVNNVGILYYSFTKYLISNIKENKIEKVFFLARDGQILKEVYDFIGEKEDLPKSHYIYASRRCLNIPSIYELNEENIDILLSNTDGKDIRYLFKKIGLDYKNYSEMIDKYNIGKINKKTHLDKLKNMLNELEEDILLNAKEEREILVKYLNQFDISNKNVGVVDIGWNGTLQNSINRICQKENINVNFFGYYLGIKEKTKEYSRKNNNYSGLLFSNELEKNFKIVAAFNAMFEELFIANHGSVIKLKESNESIEAVCENFEYSKEEYSKLKSIQKGAVDYFKKAYELDKKYNFLENNKENALLKIKEVFLNPTLEDIDNLGKIKHYDYDVKYNCNPKLSIAKYIFNPKHLLKDYKESKWKIGFVKKVFKSNMIIRVFKKVKGV